MNKYDEFMNRIEITPDMRSRLLSGITAAVNENADTAAGDGNFNEQKAPESVKKDEGSVRMRRILRIAVPIVAAAAVLVLAFVFGQRLFARKGASGAAPAAYDSAVAGGGSADMGNGADHAGDVMEAAAEEAADAEMEETRMAMGASEKAETTAAASTVPETEAKGSDALEAVPYNVFYTNHHIPLTGAEYPSVTLVTSRSQLEETFMTESYDDPLAAQEFLSEMECSEFTEEYFKTKDVLIILLEEGSGSISHTLTSIKRADTDSPWTVHIKRRVPEVQTDDMAYWYIVAEIDKNILENSSIEITLD